MAYASISSHVLGVITALLTPTTTLQSVSEFPAKENSKFPWAAVYPDESNEQVFDTVSDFSEYSFTVRIVDRNDGASTTENTLRALVDSVLSALRQVSNLPADCPKASFAVKWGWEDAEMPLRVVEIKATYSKLDAVR